MRGGESLGSRVSLGCAGWMVCVRGMQAPRKPFSSGKAGCGVARCSAAGSVKKWYMRAVCCRGLMSNPQGWNCMRWAPRDTLRQGDRAMSPTTHYTPYPADYQTSATASLNLSTPATSLLCLHYAFSASLPSLPLPPLPRLP